MTIYSPLPGAAFVTGLAFLTCVWVPAMVYDYYRNYRRNK